MDGYSQTGAWLPCAPAWSDVTQLRSGSCRAALWWHGAQPNKQSRLRFINLTLISTAY